MIGIYHQVYSPHVVSHDELLRRVWEDNGIIVPVNTLHQSISIIRRGLNKVRPDGGSLVKNVPGKGFRFTGVVTGGNKENREFSAGREKSPLIEPDTFFAIKNHVTRWGGYGCSNTRIYINSIYLLIPFSEGLCT
ncbi:hypothetical protein FNJ15_21835 [Salmonella enterica subsp. diarizonae]|nr:hypothetical protein [Salmonella enterica subsp. diarizonae]